MASLTSLSGQPQNSLPVDVEIATLHPATSPSHGLSSPKLQGFHILNVSDENIGGKDGKHGPQHEFELVQTMRGSVGEYKVYRRRWAGLFVLMAMNIVTSWGVRLANLFVHAYRNKGLIYGIQWLTFAPVSNYSQEYFGLSSVAPINWLSTVIFFAYVVISP